MDPTLPATGQYYNSNSVLDIGLEGDGSIDIVVGNFWNTKNKEYKNMKI